jgi:flagellin-like hook-associated protein FlgL
VTSQLDRAITLSTEGSNGKLNSAQDSAANNEYQSILAEINNIGSTKYEILWQTGIAALAQANGVHQEVTKLLQ